MQARRGGGERAAAARHDRHEKGAEGDLGALGKGRAEPVRAEPGLPCRMDNGQGTSRTAAKESRKVFSQEYCDLATAALSATCGARLRQSRCGAGAQLAGRQRAHCRPLAPQQFSAAGASRERAQVAVRPAAGWSEEALWMERSPSPSPGGRGGMAR